MPRIELAPQQQWFAGFTGEWTGNIHMTNNIDLERYKGKFSLGESLTAITTEASLSNITVAPVAFVRTAADNTDKWWAVVGGGLVKSTSNNPESSWANDAIASSPTAPLYDAIEFQGALLVPTATDIARLNAGTWTAAWWTGLSGASALQSAAHRFVIYAGAVLITDGQYINTYDGTVAKDPAITLPQQFAARWMKVYGDFVYIGGATTDGSEARVYAWDRASTVYVAEFGTGDIDALAGFVTGGNFYIVTLNGSIKKFTGQGFRTVAAFPTLELNKTIGGAGVSPTGLHPNGVAADEKIAKIFVNFGVLADFRLLSGIWTFDSETNNLYHSSSIKNNVAKDYSQNELSAAGAIKNTVRTQGRWLVGGTAYRTYTSATRIGIFSSDEELTSGRGYVITQKIPAKNARRFFNDFILRFRRLDTSTNRIRALYRIQDDNTLPTWETITWATATTFTGSDATATTGDFVEVLAGDNAGALARITNKTAAPAPFTFTIDLTLNSSTLAARARYLRFIDLGTISSQALQNQLHRVSRDSEWVQFLIEIRGTQTSPQIENAIIEYDELNV